MPFTQHDWPRTQAQRWPEAYGANLAHSQYHACRLAPRRVRKLQLLPRGELKRELIACLRHHKQSRKPRSRGTDRRGQIPDMQSIHIRPPKIEDRAIPGFVVLAKMDNATTKAVVDSFSAVLNREPVAMRKTMTYDQGREMHGHKILTERAGVQIYFSGPHSLWQRGSNENTNGLLRQYMPKCSDLSIYP